RRGRHRRRWGMGDARGDRVRPRPRTRGGRSGGGARCGRPRDRRNPGCGRRPGLAAPGLAAPTGRMRPVRTVRAGAVPWLVAAPPAVLTLVASLVGIGRYGFGNDEYATWYASTLPWPDLFRLLDHQDVMLG